MSLKSAEYIAKLEEITQAESDLAKLNFKLDEISADAALMVGSFLPPPAGTAADIVSLGKSLGTGDWGGAFWDAVGIIPIVGDGAKAAAKGGKLANKLADVKKAITKATESIQKKRDELAELCKKNRVAKKDEVTNAANGSATEVCDAAENKKVKQTREIAKDNYRGRFNAERHKQGKPRLPDDYDAHHKIPQEYQNHPDFKDFDFHQPDNIIGIKGSRSNINTHQQVTNDWAEFRKTNPNANGNQIRAFAQNIDKKYSDDWFK